MKTQFSIVFILFLATFGYGFIAEHNEDCKCDSLQVEKIIQDKNFNRIERFDDTLTLNEIFFYKLSKEDNRQLWFRDIENIKGTQFTSFWDDYHEKNYHASHKDFVNYYRDKENIELAFQFGPSFDLWAYQIFVIKKIGNCYVATWSYFRHARFTGKSYAILDKCKLDSLFLILSQQKCIEANETETYNYTGYFIDNRNKKSFHLILDKIEDTDWEYDKKSNSFKEVKVEIEPDPEIKDLIKFLGKEVNWIHTYTPK